jgi:heptosyltransferase I
VGYTSSNSAHGARSHSPPAAPVPLVELPRGGRVLIVMMSAIGDAVHVLPVVTALRRHDPSLHLSWVLQSGPASLVHGHRDVDVIVPFDRHGGWRALRDVRRQLRGTPFDVLLDLQVYLKASLVTLLAPARVKLGFDRARARDLNWLVNTRRIPPHPPQHVQDQYFEFLEALGVDPEPVAWGLGPWSEEREAQRAFACSLDRPAAALVIGTSSPEKDWPAERWGRLARALDARGLRPVLVGGTTARERETEAVIRAESGVPVLSTLGCSLRALVGILDASALVVSGDTGPMHIAVALDAPTIVLAGPMNPRRTGPYRRFGDLLVDAYGERGEVYGPSSLRRPGRMARISVEDVLARVEVWEASYRAARRARLAAGGLLPAGA